MKPTYKLMVGESDLGAALGSRLLSLRVVDEAGLKSDRLELTIDEAVGIELPGTGVVIECHLGYQSSGMVAMGSYVVDEAEYSGWPRTLTIRAKAADMTGALKECHNRTFSSITLGEVVGTVAGDHGFQWRVSEELSALSIAHLVQEDETDLHFLLRTAELYDGTLKVLPDMVVMTVRGSGTSVSGASMAVSKLSMGDLIQYRLTVERRDSYGAVQARWWDAGAGQLKTEKAGSETPVLTLKGSYSDGDTARRAAQAELARRQRATAKLSATVIGTPGLAAETLLELKTYWPDIGSTWRIAKVEHSLSEQGFSSAIEAESI